MVTPCNTSAASIVFLRCDTTINCVSLFTLHISLDTAFDEMAHTVVWAKEQAPELKTVLVSGDVYANGGANDVQEVAYALATAVCYVRQLAQRNIDIHTIARSMMFTFSMVANFFYGNR